VDGSTIGLGDVDLGVFYGLCERAGWHEDVALTGSATITAGVQTFLGVDPSTADGGGDSAKAPAAAATVEDTPDDKRSMLVIVDTRGTVKCWSLLRTMPYWRSRMVRVATAAATPQEHLEYLRKGAPHVDVLTVGSTDASGHADLRELLVALKQRYGAKVVRVDSGGVLIGELLRAGLVDELSVVVYPVLSGATGKTLLAGALPSPTKVALISSEQLAEGIVWLRYSITQEPPSKRSKKEGPL